MDTVLNSGSERVISIGNEGSEIEKKRGKAWLAWEDRALAKQVLCDDSVLNKIGKKEDRWREVSDNLKRLVGMDRSWSSCKNRMDLLVEWYRKDESRSKQKTGADEEVNDYIRNMTDIVLLFDSVSSNAEVKKKAKERITRKKEKGKQIMAASIQGQVRKRDLLDEYGPDSPGDRASKRQRTKTPKHQLAQEIHVAVEGIQRKSEEVKKAIQERNERDRENLKTQKEISAKLDILTQTMTVFLQQSMQNQKHSN